MKCVTDESHCLFTNFVGGDIVVAAQLLEEVKWGIHEILIISYSALTGRYEDQLKEICWRMVIFDEVRTFRNSRS